MFQELAKMANSIVTNCIPTEVKFLKLGVN